MSAAPVDALRESLESYVGQPLGGAGRSTAPDVVNLPMIRHWVDALDDQNPVYLDAGAAVQSGFGEIVAPPAMLQTWTMARPIIEGIAERGGSPVAMSADTPLVKLDDAGFIGTLATNSVLEFERYLHVGEQLTSATVVESISECKSTGLGAGYFLTWVTTYCVDDGEEVGRQVFRVLKFKPGAPGPPREGNKAPKTPAPTPSGEKLPDWNLELTYTMVVAGAIASRDFMPVHHDAEYARAQHAPDIFLNILTTNGYVSRYVTDWAGPNAQVKKIDIRLGAPAVPGKTLRFTGQVASEREENGRRVLAVAVKAANELGDHVTGSVEIELPAS